MKFLLIIFALMGIGYAQDKDSFCPSSSSLVREGDTGRWQAPNGWFSTEFSFSRTAGGFLAAYYRGQSLGTITCIYSGTDDAPNITIFNTQLVNRPKGPNWAKKNNQLICATGNIQDCPFQVFNTDESDQDINKLLLELPKR